MTAEEDFKIDVIPQASPALSARSDIPVVETKPDSQAAVEPKPDAAADSAKTEETVESATTEAPDDPSASDKPEGKPKSQGVQKRIDELVRQREDAERRAETEKAEKLRLLALVEQGSKPAPAVVEEKEPQRPSREAFTEPGAYEQALADYADQKASWSATKAVKEALAADRQEREQEAQKVAHKAAQDAYSARVSKTSEKYADYKQVAESPDVTVSIPMAQAILESDQGPEIQYFLGKNPAEAKRISALHPVSQLVELGRIVAKLTVEVAPVTPAAKPNPVSNAPKPIKPLESKSEPVVKDPNQMSMDEYAAYAKKRDSDARKAGARR